MSSNNIGIKENIHIFANGLLWSLSNNSFVLIQIIKNTFFANIFFLID